MQNALEDPRTRAAEYVVSASDDELIGLWREYSQEAREHNWGTPTNPRVQWEQDRGGWMVHVGDFGGYSVNIVLTYARVLDAPVLFWSPCSRVVDWELCESWLCEHIPAYAERHTNAANFGHCLVYLRTAKEQR
jgi:hypothetical protein